MSIREQRKQILAERAKVRDEIITAKEELKAISEPLKKTLEKGFTQNHLLHCQLKDLTTQHKIDFANALANGTADLRGVTLDPSYELKQVMGGEFCRKYQESLNDFNRAKDKLMEYKTEALPMIAGHLRGLSNYTKRRFVEEVFKGISGNKSV